jgi:NAD(P)-dependent dehydrogenase (short-subunit alcohol dehydrogenase family)
MNDFAGRVALITGAASGIGRAAASAFAAQGAAVVVADIDEAGGAEAAEAICGTGGRAVYRRVDVSDPADIEALVAATVERFGRLDFAVNNAGIGGSGIEDPWDPENFDRIMAVNARSIFHCMRHETAQMLRQGGGAIVNSASVAGLVGVGSFAYSASKHAVVGLTRTAAIFYARQGIRINAIAPSAIDTPMVQRALQLDGAGGEALRSMNPNGRIGRPEEAADAIVWLCSDAAGMINGHVLPIDGGFTAR